MELKEMSLKELKKYDTYLFTIADIEVRDKEIERLHSIIKEVREYIKRKDICIDTRKTDGSMDYVDLEKELLEILDKVKEI